MLAQLFYSQSIITPAKTLGGKDEYNSFKIASKGNNHRSISLNFPDVDGLFWQKSREKIIFHLNLRLKI
ncbi:MAG: hypothetical protein ACI308_10305 [Muribaculaceae bacterium]